jgi:hypothetical protein
MLALVPRGTRPAHVARIIGWAVLVAVLVLLLPLIVGYNPLAAWLAGLPSHEEMEGRRPYGVWLLFGPWDLLLFMGLPVGLLFLGRALRGLERFTRHAMTTVDRLSVSTLLVLVLFLLSGLSRAELGRIAIPLMPFGLLAGLSAPKHPGPTAKPTVGGALLIGILLAAISIVLRLRWVLP